MYGRDIERLFKIGYGVLLAAQASCGFRRRHMCGLRKHGERATDLSLRLTHSPRYHAGECAFEIRSSYMTED